MALDDAWSIPEQGPAPESVPAPVRAASAGEWRVLVVAVRDGVIAVASALLVAFLALQAVVHAVTSSVSVGQGDYYNLAAVLTGTGLGVPERTSISADLGTMSGGGNGSDGIDMRYSVVMDLRVTVWLLPFIVIAVAFLLNRRAERKHASGAPIQLLGRALATGIGASLTVLLLAVTAHGSQQGLLPSPLGSALGSSLNEFDSLFRQANASSGLVVPYVFLGPLLLVLAVALLARAGVWLSTAQANPRAEQVRASLAPWSPAARTVWRQARVIGLLTGLALWIRLFISAAQDDSASHHLGVIALAGVLLFGNLAVYGTFLGFGATLTAGVATTLSGVLASAASQGNSGLGGLDSTHNGIGLLNEHGQWFLWVLFAAVVLGTVTPALLSLRGGRFATKAGDHPLRGCWRPVVLGVLGALAAVLLGSLSAHMNAVFGTGNGMNLNASVGPNLFAALGLAALWFLLGYLAVGFVERRRRS